MPKVKTKQQTIFLPEEMIAWIHEEEARTGATLSNIVAAAICGYSLLGLSGKAHCMNLAGTVQQGDSTFADLPVFAWERVVTIVKAALVLAKTDDEKKDARARLRIAEGLLSAAREGMRWSMPAADMPTYLAHGTDTGGNFDPR